MTILVQAGVLPRSLDWEGGLIPTGGRIQLSQNHLPQNFDFSSNFAHFILKILENLKMLANIKEKTIENRDFCGDIPSEFRAG